MSNKSKFIFNIVCFIFPLFVIGGWMIVGQKPEGGSIEKASVSALKAVWGAPVGFTILIFASFLLLFFILDARRIPKVKRPEISFLVYDFSLVFLSCALALYCIILVQSFLTNSSFLPATFAYKDLSSIHLIFITVIIVSGISTLFTGFINRKK